MAAFRRIDSKTYIVDNGRQIPILLYAKRFKVKKNRKVATAARNTVLTYFSDFISGQGGLRPATASANFLKPAARPDQQGSLNQFLKTYGINVQETALSGGAQAFNEFKQKISEGGRSTTLTSRSLARESSLESSFLGNFSLKREKDKEDPNKDEFGGVKISSLSSLQLHKWVNTQPELKQGVIETINQKFENFTVIDYLDLSRGGKPRVRILPNASSMLNLSTNFTQSVFLSAQRIKNKKGKVSIKLHFSLSDLAYDNFLKKSTDVTLKFHQSLGKNVNSRFLTYATGRFNSHPNSMEDFINELFSFAKEFELGANTPIVYRTIVKKLKAAKNNVNINLTPDDLGEKDKKQTRGRFVSNIQMSTLIRQEVERRMPKGVPGGKPKSPTILTYRTGNFVDSINVIQDFRNRLIKYYYSPNYLTHERRGQRPPRFLIQASIRETVRAVYGTQFRIHRGF
jgi:hypothetical protein